MPPAAPAYPHFSADDLGTWKDLLRMPTDRRATTDSILEALAGKTESEFCSLLNNRHLSDELLAPLVPLVAKRLLEAISRTTAKKDANLLQWVHVMRNMGVHHSGAGWVLANPHVFAVVDIIRANAIKQAQAHQSGQTTSRKATPHKAPPSRQSSVLKYLGIGLLSIEESPLSDIELLLDARMSPTYSDMEWVRQMLRYPQTQETHWRRAWELYMRGMPALTTDEALPFVVCLAENPDALQSAWAVELMLTYWRQYPAVTGVDSTLWRRMAKAGHWEAMHSRLFDGEKPTHDPAGSSWSIPALLLSDDQSLLERLNEDDWRLIVTLIASPGVIEKHWPLRCLAHLHNQTLPENLEEAFLGPVLKYAPGSALASISEETWDRLHNSADGHVRQAAIFARCRRPESPQGGVKPVVKPEVPANQISDSHRVSMVTPSIAQPGAPN